MLRAYGYDTHQLIDGGIIVQSGLDWVSLQVSELNRSVRICSTSTPNQEIVTSFMVK